MASDGLKPPESAEKSLGDIVGEVSEKASLLVREEIELAKTEVQQRISRIVKGVASGAVAGIFAVFALIYLLHALAWLFHEELDVKIWVGFALVTLILVVVGAIAGFLAYRLVRRGTPPTPQLAIEEAKKTRETLEEVRR